MESRRNRAGGDRREVRRRSPHGLGSEEEVTEFDPQAYIVRENTNVVRDPRRLAQARSADSESREHARSRRATACWPSFPAARWRTWSSFPATAWPTRCRSSRSPRRPGYGDPMSKFVRVGDGARPIWAVEHRSAIHAGRRVVRKNQPPAPYLLIATRSGQVMQLSFSAFRAPSTKAGRRYCRLREEDASIFVELVSDGRDDVPGHPRRPGDSFQNRRRADSGWTRQGRAGHQAGPDDEVLGAIQLAARATACT